MKDEFLKLPPHASTAIPWQDPSLSAFDSWVVYEIESQTIPGVSTATELIGRFKTWGNVHLPDFEMMTSTTFGLALKSLKRRGVRKKVEKAATYYHLDLPTLRKMFIADGKTVVLSSPRLSPSSPR